MRELTTGEIGDSRDHKVLVEILDGAGIAALGGDGEVMREVPRRGVGAGADHGGCRCS